MKPLFAFLSLFLFLLYSGKTAAREDVGESWRAVMKDQPMPESIRGLLRMDPAPSVHKEEKSQGEDFTTGPSFFTYINYGPEPPEEVSFDKNFKPESDVFWYPSYDSTKPGEEKKPFVRDFEPEPNFFFYQIYGTEQADEKPLDDLSNNVLRLPNEDVDMKNKAGGVLKREQIQEHALDDRKRISDNMNDHHDAISHMSHVTNPSKLKVFFTLKDLKVGNRMATYFSSADTSGSPPFLPKKDADAIPFSSKQIPYLLNFFSISPGSPQAKAIRETLSQCESKPIKGETKICATSLESMLGFAQSFFGPDFNFKALTTKRLTKSSRIIVPQNYTIMAKPQEIDPLKMIACHRQSYPYAVFYCHGLAGGNKVFKVPLHGDNGDLVEAVSVCHMDTSQWSPDHVSFRVLGVKPGESSVCHFIPSDHLVMIPM